MASIEEQILETIRAHGPGWCFTPSAFGGLGTREAVRLGLFRLEKKGVARRLVRGLYDFPKEHPQIGRLAPSPDAIAKALAERDGATIQPAGAYAANLLGLSEQIPAKIVFLTSGPERRVRIGKQEILLKNTVPRNMATAGRISGTIIQAFRHIGAKQINDGHLRHLWAVLTEDERKQLWKDRVFAPGWMHRHLKALSGDAHV